jgi:hypothetical protein
MFEMLRLAEYCLLQPIVQEAATNSHYSCSALSATPQQPLQKLRLALLSRTRMWLCSLLVR